MAASPSLLPLPSGPSTLGSTRLLGAAPLLYLHLGCSLSVCVSPPSLCRHQSLDLMQNDCNTPNLILPTKILFSDRVLLTGSGSQDISFRVHCSAHSKHSPLHPMPLFSSQILFFIPPLKILISKLGLAVQYRWVLWPEHCLALQEAVRNPGPGQGLRS